MNIVTGDLETFWSPTHSLSKMNSIDYVMHPETELISNALKINDGPTHCVFGEAAIREQIAAVDWDNAFFIAHNMSGFDALVYAWRLGIRPRVWGCTLAMARPIHAKTVGLSLAKLVEHYALGKKDNTALVNTRGKHLKDFTAAERNAMASYNRADVDQCYELFKKLRPHYSTAELWHLDSKIRALVEPMLQVDVPMLEQALAQERTNKRQALLALAEMFSKQVFPVGDIASADEEYLIERVRSTLASAPMFCQVLESRGVPVPMKESPSDPSKKVPALAKTDLAFQQLQEHDDELVAMAATARLSVKSTIAETRMQAFVDVAGFTGGKWPVTVSYCGADTTGRSSGWMYNPLNLPRINEHKPRPADALRMSLVAPPGRKVVVVDLAGIEMRFNHFLWNVRYSTDLWKRQPDADIYKPTAAAFFMVPVEQIDKGQRQVGKVQQLACGFGCGGDRYVDMARTMGGLILSPEEAKRQVTSWREMTPEIAHYKDGGWARCQEAFEAIINGVERPIDPHGIFWTCAEGIRLPSGRLIRYPALRREVVMRQDKKTGELRDEWTWLYGEGRHKTFIHGPKADENCLAEGTLVLTDAGWTPIENVTRSMRVHDGVEFVRHSGTVLKSVQACVNVDGVLMTPDHEVLTNEGWKEASQLPRPYRPEVRSTDRLAHFAYRREEMVLGVPVPMRGAGYERGRGGSLRVPPAGHPQLRVSAKRADSRKEPNARHVQTPRLWGLPEHARQVRVAVAQSVEELRRTWDNGVRGVASVLRSILERHGAYVPDGHGPGSRGQRRPLLAGELSMGAPARKYYEQTEHCPTGRRAGTEPTNWDRAHNPVQPHQAGVAAARVDEGAVVHKQVYDILNCGARHRFVVLGAGGPFVVHNCVQAGARDVVYDIALEVFKRTGYRPALEVYDELVYVVPEDKAEAHLAIVQEEMRKPPKWFPALVTWSEGDVGDRYGEAK